MGLFPELNEDLEQQLSVIDNIVDTTLEIPKVGRSFHFDFNKKKFVFKDGKLQETSELDAIIQWIQLCIRTYKDKFNVYKYTEFGVNTEDLFGKKLNTFVETEYRSELMGALLKNKMIKNAGNMLFTQKGKQLEVNFEVELINGELIKMESEVLN